MESSKQIFVYVIEGATKRGGSVGNSGKLYITIRIWDENEGVLSLNKIKDDIFKIFKSHY